MYINGLSHDHGNSIANTVQTLWKLPVLVPQPMKTKEDKWKNMEGPIKLLYVIIFKILKSCQKCIFRPVTVKHEKFSRVSGSLGLIKGHGFEISTWGWPWPAHTRWQPDSTPPAPAVVVSHPSAGRGQGHHISPVDGAAATGQPVPQCQRPSWYIHVAANKWEYCTSMIAA